MAKSCSFLFRYIFACIRSAYRYIARMEPATTIVSRFGGASEVASIVGVHRTRVYGWAKPREKGGTGGLIPQGHIPKLLEAARERGIPLDGNDFLLPPQPQEADHG